jgi:phospholipase/carboxylesterase
LISLVAPLGPSWASEAKNPTPSLEYVEFITGGGDGSGMLPLIIAVHGMGDRPENFIRIFHELKVPARVVAPRAPHPYGRGFSWFQPLKRSATRAEWGRGITDQAKKIDALIKRLKKKHGVVPYTVITGFSQGGMLSYALAVHHSDAAELVVPMGGYLPSPLKSWKKKPDEKLPMIRALHGRADNIIDFKSAQATVRWLKKRGVDVALRGFPRVRHRIPDHVVSALHGTIRYFERAGTRLRKAP